jgi:hypothetical protein
VLIIIRWCAGTIGGGAVHRIVCLVIFALFDVRVRESVHRKKGERIKKSKKEKRESTL